MTTLTLRKTGRTKDDIRASVRFLAKHDPYAFARVVLGYTAITPTFHMDLCHNLQTTPNLRNLYMVPRGYFKTTILTIAANIRRILNNPDIRILIASNKAENAEAVLSEIKGLLTPGRSEVADRLYWLFPDIFFRDPAKEADVWTNARIAVKARSRRREPTITTIGLHGELTGRHYDHGSFDDLVGLENSQSREERQRTIAWWQAAQSLLDPGSTEDIIGCLPADAEVLMEDGTTKPIDCVKLGEHVWAADVDGSMVPRIVKAMVPQGLAETLTITTSAKTLRATPTHPFLCHTEKGLDLFWARADELKVGDYIVSIKEIPGKLEHQWMTEDFCWLFGFLMGDGWASVYERRGHVGICLSKDEELNARVKRTAAEWLPGLWNETPFEFLRNDARKHAVALQDLGLIGTAKTKRLPQWAFRLPPEHRRALLRGFCEADGSHQQRSDDAWRVEIANGGLLKDLRHLANLCGVRTGALISRQRMIQAPNSPAEVLAETHHCLFNFATVERSEIYHLSRKLDVAPGLRQERIVSVAKNAFAEPVYDLTVDGTPSFFANGLAVHNTPWDFDDLYRWLLVHHEKHGMRLGIYKRSCWEADPQGEDVGPPFGRVRSTFPERFPVSELLRIKREIGSTRFAAQYLLEPVDEETAVFPLAKKTVWPRSKLPDFPHYDRLWKVMTVDPAISQKGWADYLAIAVVGFDHDNTMYVLHLDRGKWGETRALEEIFSAYNRFKPTVIGIEPVAFQVLFFPLLTREGEKRGQYLPLVKLERDTKIKKNTRIRVLEPFWSAGQIILADDLPVLDDFLDEASRFRLTKESTHDDMLDALADCLQLRVRPAAPDRAPRLEDPDLAERAAFQQQLAEARAATHQAPLDYQSLQVAYDTHLKLRRYDEEAQMVATGVDEFWR